MTRAANRIALSAALAFGLAAPAAADGLRVRTEVSLNTNSARATSLDASLGFARRDHRAGSVRLMWEKSLGDFRFEIHSHMAVNQGDILPYGAAIAPFYPAPATTTLFDLTRTWQASPTSFITNTFDRLSLSYASSHFVLKIGRQAITWGSGMVFHPADIVAPFAPTAIDTAYKPGADMVYAQMLFDSGADIQAIAVPRGLAPGGPVDFAASTYAVRGQTALGSLDANLMLARDRGDSVGSFGLSGALGGASWNAEYVHWRLASGATHPSWLFNIANYGTLGGWNVSYFAEYFHNGFGVDAGVPLDSLPASLTKRMSTGQVFLTGRDFLSLGGNVEMTADLSVAPNAIVSLADRSALAGFTVNYTLGDNTNLVFNFSQTFGADGTEFGGRETSAGSGIFASGGRSMVLQLVQFF
ncbi:MAG: hypothetical protein K8F59_06950 [Rhodobacteraceae bacterium]|nr:hypothetical protein [Paracoccaceae bacterium]